MLFLIIVPLLYIGVFNLKLENLVDADPALLDRRPTDSASVLAAKIIDNPFYVMTHQSHYVLLLIVRGKSFMLPLTSHSSRTKF